MFDLAWSEIALIGIVALVVIGPKDLPEAIRGVARGIQKLRRMAGEFQSQADELVREAKLDEVRNQIHEVRSAVNEIRNFDLRTEVEKSVDADGTIRRTFTEDPLKPSGWADPPPVVTTPPPEAMEGAMAPAPEPPPAFLPPGIAPPPFALPPAPAPASAVASPEPPPAAPAFLPPGAGGGAATSPAGTPSGAAPAPALASAGAQAPPSHHQA